MCRLFLADLNVTEGGEAHLSGHAPTGSQQRPPRPLQSRQTDGRQPRAEVEEKAEGGGHDRRLRADQRRIQQGQDVKELVLRLRTVTLENPQHLTLTPNVGLLQPGRTQQKRFGGFITGSSHLWLVDPFHSFPSRRTVNNRLEPR